MSVKDEIPGARLSWQTVLLIMLACHGTSTLLLRLVPTIAPEIVTQYGWDASFVGWLATAANFGSIVVVAGGVGLLRVLGSVRAIRVGLAAAGLGILFLTFPVPALALVACFVVGMGHGPTNPAGNDILQRYVPRGAQGLIFSIKQSSVPVAGIIGGLVLPGVAQLWGVAGAMVFGAVVAALTIVATAPLRRQSDIPFRPASLLTAVSRESVTAPTRIVRSHPGLRSLALSGSLLAFVQSIWFVYLTSFFAFALGYSGTEAGVLYALMQATSVAGRLLLGWGADRLRSGAPFILASLVLSTLSTLALAGLVFADRGWLPPLVCLIGGLAAAGWNGILVSETVRLAPPDRLYEAVSGVTLAIGSGVVAGPLAVSLMLELGMGWGGIISSLALLPLIGVSSAYRQLRREGAGEIGNF
jgi:MFS family permease